MSASSAGYNCDYLTLSNESTVSSGKKQTHQTLFNHNHSDNHHPIIRRESSSRPLSSSPLVKPVNGVIKTFVKTTQSSLLTCGILSHLSILAAGTSVNSDSINVIHRQSESHSIDYPGQVIKSLSLGAMAPIPQATQAVNETSHLIQLTNVSSSDVTSDHICPLNCSGHGECYNGICFCHVEYSGANCDNPNLSYFIAFSTVFYMICLVSLVQLALCIKSEFDRMKPRSVMRAFRITTQKALYFFICLATGLRGFYFAYIPDSGHMLSHDSSIASSSSSLSFASTSSSPFNIPSDNNTYSSVQTSSSYKDNLNNLISTSYPHDLNDKNYSNNNWTAPLLSAYYPLLMSGSSLVVCFWAELFHLHNVSPERPAFLSKSFVGFILFNVVTYSLLLAELVLLRFADTTETERSLFLSIFNSIYAVLMLIVVVFFLIYGVEVYFKLRGAFVQGESNAPADFSQLHQSRLGLISQAVLLLITVLFIFSDTLGSFWKNKVPILSRNTHEIMFRVVELGVALWFPCVLWNCVQPEALWILNPRKILKRRQNKSSTTTACTSHELKSLVDVDGKKTSETSYLAECWICYDTERTDAGPLMQPCACKGDVAAVHHECLKTWLMESNCNPDSVKCKVCNESYRITRGEIWFPSGLTISHYLQTATIIVIMVSAATSVWMVVKLFNHMYVRTISVGSAILVEYICLRFLGFNILSAYNRAKFSAIKIKGKLLIQMPEVLQKSNHDFLTCSCASSSVNSQSTVESSKSSYHGESSLSNQFESSDEKSFSSQQHQCKASSSSSSPSSSSTTKLCAAKISPVRRAIATSIAETEFDDSISCVMEEEGEATSVYSVTSSNNGSSCSSRSCSFRSKILKNCTPVSQGNSRHHSYGGGSLRDEQIALATNGNYTGTVVQIHCVDRDLDEPVSDDSTAGDND